MQVILSKKDEAKLAQSQQGKALTGGHASAHELLSMYRDPPREEIAIDKFERLALERLRVLKGIEDAKLRGKSELELTEKYKELEKNLFEGEHPRRADQLSHFILRLAYCGNPTLRKWFLSMECELFRLRFAELLQTPSDRERFLKREGLEYTALQPSETTPSLDEKLRQVQVANGEKDDGEKAQQVYKVPFTSVPDLVAQRRVYLSRGYAYVSQKDLASLVVQDFRTQLSKGLASINRRWREMFPDSDLRLRPLVEGLSQRYLGPDLGSTTAQRRSDLTLANLPAVSARHFPLCMHTLMQSLRRDHHLRHNGRQQLSLFLKSIGLPLEEALVFWRTEFAPRTPGDKFDKEYAYNIRHNYGKEGKMADYTAHSCVSIIRMSGGADEHHGCPFRRMEEGTLRANLSALGCESSSVNEAMQKKAGGHFQLACACAFEGVHKAPMDVGINHPAQYYLESRKVWDEREAKAKESGSSTAAATAAGAGAAAGGQAGAAPMAVDGTPGPAGAASRTGAAATPFGGLGRTPAGSSGRPSVGAGAAPAGSAAKQ